jgi:hypothetical protein
MRKPERAQRQKETSRPYIYQVNHREKTGFSDSKKEKRKGGPWEYMQLLERDPEVAGGIFTGLHYYSLDNITHSLYRASGVPKKDRELLTGVLDPVQRRLALPTVRFPRYTRRLMLQTGLVEKVVNSLGLIPQKKDTVYTVIRWHTLNACNKFSNSSSELKASLKTSTIVGHLWDSHTPLSMV